MNEKIYLGFSGKENIRMGESLVLIGKFVYVIKQYMNFVPTEKLEEYISNPYIMYNIKDIKMLTNLFNYTTGTMLFGELANDNRKNILSFEKENDYIISLATFKFLSEKVWPEIAKGFIQNIAKTQNYFTLRLNIPLSIIRKLYNNAKETDYIKFFTYEFSKWIDFHFIGRISKILDENENLTIYLDVKY